MAPPRHLYLTVRGGWNATNLAEEHWQFGLRFAGVFGQVDDVGTFPQNLEAQAVQAERMSGGNYITTNFLLNGPAGSGFSPDDWLEDVVSPAVIAFHGRTAGQAGAASNKAIVQELRLYLVDSGGLVAQTNNGPARASLNYGTPVAGADTINMLPPQTAVAISLGTSRSGRRGRGRFYLPPLTSDALTTDGLLKSSVPPRIATAAQTFVRALNTSAPGQDLSMAVVVSGKPFTNYAKVTKVRVGDLVDTQRRRRKSIQEDYSPAEI